MQTKTTKKEISSEFAKLRKHGYKVWNFNSNQKFNRGAMKDWVDIVVIGHGSIYFIEVKIGSDKHSEGQLETKQLMCHTSAIYYEVTENNYKQYVDYILSRNHD